MKKIIIHKLSIVVMVSSFIMNIYAQKSDNQSKKIMDIVLNHYKNQKNNYFKFSYGNGNNGKITKIQTGIFYSTPSYYKLKIMETEQIFDGKKVYNINNDEQEVTIAKANGSEVTLSPTSYLNNYHKNYNTSYLGKRKINNISVDLIKLVPMNSNGIKYIHLYINTVSKHIVKIEQYANNNELNTITITDYKANQNLSKDMFVFDRNNYKNYLITEL